jgi:hypothetical protein
LSQGFFNSAVKFTHYLLMPSFVRFHRVHLNLRVALWAIKFLHHSV